MGRDVLTSAALFLAAFAAYLAGAAPSLYGGDSGELIVSAASLGVSHAPGYPLHALLGRAFAGAVPWGGFAWRVNLLSAALSGLTAAGLFRLLAARLGKRGPAVAGALLYAALPVVWDQAQTAEVFALNNFFAVALLLAWPYWNAPAAVGGANLRRLYLWAFLYGAGLANHLTLVLLLPGFAWMFGSTMTARTDCALWKKWLAPVLFGVLGTGLYVYLPLRAAKHPPVNFGDPHTWNRFVNVVTRKEFGSLELHPASVPFRTVETARQQAAAYGRQDGRVAGRLLLVAGVLGLCLLRPRAWLLFWLLCGPLFFWMSNLSPFNTLAQWRMERFALLPALFLCAGAAFCWEALRRRGTWLAALFSLGLLADQAANHRPFFRWNTAFRDFGRNVAASLPPGAALLIDDLFFDEPTSALANRLVAERRRPDLQVIYRPGTLFELFYGEDILEIPREARARRKAEREEALWDGLRRPLSALALSADVLPGAFGPWKVGGLVYQPADRPSAGPYYVQRARLELPADYPTRLILAHYPYFAAKAAFDRKDLPAARGAAASAAFLGDRMEWLRSNLGSLWSKLAISVAGGGEEALERAGREFERAAAIDPYFAPAQFGLGYVRLRKEKWLEAAAAFEEAARVKPGWSEPYYMLGLAYRSAGKMERARGAWDTFLRLDPASPLAPAVRGALNAG